MKRQLCALVLVLLQACAADDQPMTLDKGERTGPSGAEAGQSANVQGAEPQRGHVPVAPQPATERRQEKTRGEMQGAVRDQAMPSTASRLMLEQPPMHPALPPDAHYNREGYDALAENRFRSPLQSPLSTFGLDVDTASYSNVRRFLSQGRLPPAAAVRIEELINYFDYTHPEPTDGQSLRISTEVTHAPWNPAHRLAMIGVRAKSLQEAEQAPNRLVFLLDTSGSMRQPNKLPLLKRSFQILVEQLDARDSVAIVAYAGSAGLVLPPTSGAQKEAIYAALNRLQAGGSTAGGRGIELAYQVAAQQHMAAANNRVILATDGDFNVGVSSDGELVRMIEARRDSGIFLSVLGLGTGNYQDAKMQKLAAHGNGTHHYIDTDREAERVFSTHLQSTLYTVAKDAKIQVEWNPAVVASYRLIGYENRLLAAEDFDDDRKDAGDVGAGHSLTVLYEIVPVGGQADAGRLRYQSRALAGPSNELGLVKWRYKAPDENISQAYQQVIGDQLEEAPSANLGWASSVAELGLLLGQSPHRAQASFEAVIARAQSLLGDGADAALRREFIGLVRQARVASESATGMTDETR